MYNQPLTKPIPHDKLGHIVLMAMEEIIGRNGVIAAMNFARHHHAAQPNSGEEQDGEFRFEELSQVQAALENIYGWRGGRGLALRSGRACFKYGLREFAASLSAVDPSFSFLPLNKKLFLGAEHLARAFNSLYGDSVHIEERPDHLILNVQDCPICLNRHSETPVCHLLVGSLQEGLYWISGGKNLRIEETFCIARGDPNCTFVIEKPVWN